MAVDEELFKRALSHWASGVTIVTSRSGAGTGDGETVHGMTVSAFASVSLAPPLVLVCADKASDTHGVIAEGGVFAVHVLGRGQEALSNRFAAKGEEHRRFEGLDWKPGETGVPILPEAVAVLECAVVDAHEAGDHVIYVGRVEHVRIAEGEPLIYHRGGYRSLGDG